MERVGRIVEHVFAPHPAAYGEWELTKKVSNHQFVRV